MKYYLSFLFLFATVVVKSQFFLEFSGGYTLPLKKNEMPYPYYTGYKNTYYSDIKIPGQYPGGYIYAKDRMNIRKKPVKTEFVSGSHYTCSFGYYFNKYIGLAVDCYRKEMPKDKNAEFIFDFNTYYTHPYYREVKSRTVFSFSEKTNTVSSCMILQKPVGKNIGFFVKPGISVSEHEILINTKKEYYYSDKYEIIENFNEKYYVKDNLGYFLSLGIKYSVEYFTFYIEGRYSYEKFSPSELYAFDYYIDYYSVNPPDHYVILEAYNNDISATDVSPVEYPFNKEKRYKTSFVYSSLSFNIGMQFVFDFRNAWDFKKDTIQRQNF